MNLQVERLEQLLERVRRNAALARPPRAPASQLGDDDSDERFANAVADAKPLTASPPPVDVDDIDFDDFAEGEMVEIDADAPSFPPPVPAHAAFAADAGEFVPQSEPSGLQSDRGYGALGGDAPALGGYEPAFGESLGDEAIIPLQTKQEAAFDGQFGSEHPAAIQPDQPTMEQLGATIGLEGGEAGPALELDVRSPPPQEISDLEVSLPARGFAGAYDENLSPPPSAQEDLAALDGSAIVPHAVLRSAISPTVSVAEIVDNRRLSGGAFGALLDDSVSLNRR